MKWIYVFIGLLLFTVSGCVKECDATYDRSDLKITKTNEGIKVNNKYSLPVVVKTIIVYNEADSVIGGFSGDEKILSLFSHTFQFEDFALTDSSSEIAAAAVLYQRQYCDYGVDGNYDSRKVEF